ncbi:DHA2 family efflux MFS transporter permease subunit [Actinomadura kijaniata]|uniref:DHA2 family efflux MFS transporter permease subunit n=1 Tax=Actinomadura kijaniata TaxID=46161 RepID=UPI0008364C05|nr:DHA2 family efflux MFS transporter permease subunit [Actinomadura kijaniata]
MVTTTGRDTGRALVPLAATLLVGAVAALLDTTIVAVALDDLGRELGASVGVVQWVTTAYVLAMTAVIPLVGWSVGRFGARAVWGAALLLFLAGSVLTGLAWSPGSVVAFRVVQGLGGGMILPLTQLVLARAAGPERLGRVMGVVGLIGQLAPVSGPVLGGFLVDGWGWRWIFFVNVPLVLVALLMMWRWFPRDDRRERAPLDAVGLALLPTAVVLLLYALSSAETGFRTASWVSLVGGAGLLAAYVTRSVRHGGTGLIDLRLFLDRGFRGGALMMFVLGVTTWGPMFLLPLYFQRERGLDAFDAGLALAPQSAGMALALLVAGRLTDRMPPRPLALAGLAVATLGTLPFVTGSGPALLAAALFVRGVGFGVASLPISVSLYRTVPERSIPDATGAGNVIQRIGAATGTALMALILQLTTFATALTWMFALTALGLAASVLLPGRTRP